MECIGVQHYAFCPGKSNINISKPFTQRGYEYENCKLFRNCSRCRNVLHWTGHSTPAIKYLRFNTQKCHILKYSHYDLVQLSLSYFDHVLSNFFLLAQNKNLESKRTIALCELQRRQCYKECH